MCIVSIFYLYVPLQGLSFKVSLLPTFSRAQTLWGEKREERLFKSVLHVSTVPSPLSVIELEMAGEKRLKVLH